jgi:CelD/BcsL family acetyltransferase involved in cellulose biosynthesis
MYRQRGDEDDVVMDVQWHDDIAPIAGEWDDLADRTGAPPFARPGWFGAWYDAFGRGERQLLAIRDGGRLAAVLPLERDRGVLRAAAIGHSPVYGPAAEPAALAGLATALLGSRARRRDLTMLDSRDPLLPLLRPVRGVERVVARQPWVDATGDWDSYEAGLARKFRKELRRQRRRIDEQGEVLLEFQAGGEGLDEGFAIEGSGWKSERGTAIASDPAVGRFYRSIARWAEERGWLTLAFLRVGGRAVAFDMHLEAEGAVHVLKGGFDPAWARFSPGSVLTHESLRRAFATPSLRSYEFLGGDDAYKLSWTRSVRERVRVQSFPSTPAGTLGRLAWTHGRPAAKRVLEAVRR